MRRMNQTWSAMLVVAVVLTTGVVSRPSAQEPTARPAAKEAPAQVPLKVTVTISRYEGEKKTANLPFVLWVNTGGSPSQIRMGNDVPVPTTTFAKEGMSTESYSYKALGTNIDCRATDLGNDRYRLDLTVSDSQVFRTDSTSKNMPARFQTFTATNQPILRDGQTVQFAVATDKTSGEVIKLDVTLNLVK